MKDGIPSTLTHLGQLRRSTSFVTLIAQAMTQQNEKA